MSSNIACSLSLLAIVYTSHTQDQPRVLNFDTIDLPFSTHKLNVPHHMEILIGIRIGQYANIICDIDVVVELIG